MTPKRSRPNPPRRTVGRAVAASLAALVATLLGTTAARAEISTLEGTAAPIVRINIGSGDVTIRTWDREAVAVDGDPSLSIERKTTHQPAERAPTLIPQAHTATRDGQVVLAPESFVVSSIPPGPRDAIVIKSTPQTPAGPVVVTVPSDAVFVFAFAHNGNLDVHDYRGGTFVGFTNRGRLALQNVGGTIFAQTGRGALSVSDSSTERLRARSLLGNITFERCNARQIEASSVEGSIVYDAGTFEPGLARFESTHGDVAIGAQGAAELGAHVAGDGRIYTNFERAARVSGAPDATSAIVAGGGPVVNATTQTGNVFLYDGSLRTRDRLPPAWRQPAFALAHPFVRRDIPGAADGVGRTSVPTREPTEPLAPGLAPAIALPTPRSDETRPNETVVPRRFDRTPTHAPTPNAHASAPHDGRKLSTPHVATPAAPRARK